MTWHSVEDVALIAGVHPRTIQRWCRERRIAHIRIGRCIRFSADQLDEIRDAYTLPATDRHDAVAPNPTFRSRAVVIPMLANPKAV